MSTAHGKVILLGEHAVVYGRPALAMSLSRGVSAQASRATATSLSIPAWKTELFPSSADEAPPLARAFQKLLHAVDAHEPIRVVADVQIPAGAGLGCSAALSVAIARSIDEALGRAPRSHASLVQVSLEWERVFHGTPSGIDSEVAAESGIFSFQRGAPLKRVRPKKAFYVIVGDSGEASATKSMVENVARQHERDRARVEQVFDGISALVTNASLSLEYGDLVDLGKLMDLNHALLNALMISTAKLEAMCATARHAGALGAKLTGAGGGGCMIALADDEAIARRIETELRGHASGVFLVRTEAG